MSATKHKTIIAYKAITLFSILVLVFAPALQAQLISKGLDPNKSLTQYNLDVWTTEDGLPNNSVLAMSKTRDSYMWFGTYNGLSRFDGKNFKNYDSEIKINGVLTLLEDKRGTLWIGTNGNGLIAYKNGEFTTYHTDPFFKNTIIKSLTEDNEGWIWIGTRNGLARIKDGNFQVIKHPIIARASIYALFKDAKNNIWIGTSGDGLFKYSDGNFHQYSTANGLISNFVRAIHEDAQGNLWVGTTEGITRLNDSGYKSYSVENGLPHNYVNTIFEDQQKSLWIGTDGGLVRYQNNKFEVLTTKNGLSHNTVQSLLQDDEGSLWVGTYRMGITRLKDGKFTNYSILDGLPAEVAHVIYQDASNIWIGTDNGLTEVVNGKIINHHIGKDPSSNRVRDIRRDSNNNLWIGTSNGLIRYDNGVSKQFTTKDGLPSNRIRRLAEDKNGVLWIGTDKGIAKFELGKFVIYNRFAGLKNEFIMSIFCDKKGQLWVGTNGGGLHLFEDEKFIPFIKNENLPSSIIFDISEDSHGNIWIGTNGGVSRYSEQGLTTFTTDQGLNSNSIFQVLEGIQDFWMVTNNGIFCAKKDEIEAVAGGLKKSIQQTKVYNKADGMGSDEVVGASISLRDDDGKLWFPTSTGVSVIDPKNIPINTLKPPVVIEKVEVDHQSYNLNKKINLPAGSQRVVINYSGLSFYAPSEVQFKFKLVGFDSDWQDAGNNRVAYYTNLSPGEYAFKVKAANNDGIWNETGATIELWQQAFYYQTNLFYFLLGALILLLGFLINRIRIKRLYKRNLKLIKLVDIRTNNIERQKEELKALNNIKDKMFSIISHDLRGPVSSCAGILHLYNSNNLSKEEFKVLSTDMGNKVNRMKDLLDNLLSWSQSQMNGIKVDQSMLDLNKIVSENIELLKIEAKSKNIALENLLSSDDVVLADKNMVKLVIRNLVVNAIKFTPNGGFIKISSTQNCKNIEIAVQDSGVGINAQDLVKLFNGNKHHSTSGTIGETGTGLGLQLCKEFVEKNGGEIWVESEEGKGSVFKFTLRKAPKSAAGSAYNIIQHNFPPLLNPKISTSR